MKYTTTTSSVITDLINTSVSYISVLIDERKIVNNNGLTLATWEKGEFGNESLHIATQYTTQKVLAALGKAKRKQSCIDDLTCTLIANPIHGLKVFELEVTWYEAPQD